MKARRPPKTLKNIKRPLTNDEKKEIDKKINELFSNMRNNLEIDISNPYGIRPGLDFSSSIKKKNIRDK